MSSRTRQQLPAATGPPDPAKREVRFQELLRELERDLLRIGRGLLGGWEDAQDASQRTLGILWRELPRIDDGRPLRPWVLRVHLNHCRSLLRRRKIRTWLRWEDLPHEPTQAPAGEDPDRPDLDTLLRLARRLSARQREAWLLCDLEELGSAEAGDLMGCAADTVRVHLMRARAGLREAWNKERSAGNAR